jgi:hypothetical protein
MTDAWRNRLTGGAAGLVMVALGVAQLALLVALVQPIDWGWQVVGALGTVYSLGLFAAVLVGVATSDVRPKMLIGVVTLVAAVAILAAAGAWASLEGRPFLLEAGEAGRIWTIIAADACFAVFAIGVSVGPRPPRVPALPIVGVLIGLRAFAAGLYFLPLLQPAVAADQPSGDTSGAAVLLLAVAVLGGYILIGVWDLVLGGWLIRAGRQPEGVSAAR